MRRISAVIGFCLFAASISARGDDLLICNGLSGKRPPESLGSLKVGHIVGSDRAYFQWGLGASCQSEEHHCRPPLEPYVVPGDRVAVVGSTEGFLCVEYPSQQAFKGRFFGWLPVGQVSTDQEGYAVRSLDAWQGTWHQGGATINIQSDGKALRVVGHATWQGRGAPHFGEFDYAAIPNGNTLTLDSGERGASCEVVLLALGELTAVIDNLNCGGENVSFSGFYTRANR